MTAIVPHLQSRIGVFYYVRRVPKKVTDRPLEFNHTFGGQATVRWSLRTKDRLEALDRYRDAEIKFDLMVRKALQSEIASQVSAETRRAVTPVLLSKIRLKQREAVLRPYRLAVIHREQDPVKHREELERLLNLFEEDAERITDVLIDFGSTTDPQIDVPTIARELIKFEHLDAPPASDALSLVQNAIREGLREGYASIRDICTGVEAATPRSSALPAHAPRISTVVNAHMARQDRPRTIAAFKEALSAFTSLHGDLPLDEIKRSHFTKFCEAQASDVVGGRSRKSVTRPKAAGTIQKKVKLLRSAISTAIKTGSFDGPNPAAEIDVTLFVRKGPPLNMPEKRRFGDDELAKVFSHPWFTGCRSTTDTYTPGTHRLTGMHFWVPVVALLTGCRAGELGGLMLNEVRLDSAHPHILIRNNQFRPTKSGMQREVPLLDQLIELGFADLVERASRNGHERLFQDWLPPKRSLSGGEPAWSNGAVVRAFNSQVIPVALKGTLVPGARRPVTFHSFRGAFKNMLGRAENQLPSNYVNYVLGHSLPELDQRYVGTIDLGDLYRAVRGCSFDPKLLPPAPTDGA